jgi:TonB family protein
VMTGYAWLSLAAQDSEYKERGLHLQIYKGFSAEQKEQADKAAQEIFDQFSSAAVESRLEPIYIGSTSSHGDARAIKKVYPEYPKSMLGKNFSGWVDIFFTVGKDGTTRDHFVFASPDKIFSKAVVAAVRQWQYEPAMLGGKPVAVHGKKMRFHFLLNATIDQKKIDEEMLERKEKALAGDPHAQFLYAYFLGAGLEDKSSKVDDTRSAGEDSNKWYLKAAQNGSVLANYFLGKNTLNGNMCTPDINKSMGWLQRAASKNSAEAQYLLAKELLSGERFQKNEEQGIYWLNRAATGGINGYSAAKLGLAWILATHPNKAQRNGALAQQYVLSVEKDYNDKQTYYQTAAAVSAENGDFENAIMWQEKALDDAESLKLPIETIRAQLNAYITKQPLREALQ